MNQNILFENQTIISNIYMRKIKTATNEKQECYWGDLRPANIKVPKLKKKKNTLIWFGKTPT